SLPWLPARCGTAGFDTSTRPSWIARVWDRADAASWRAFDRFYQPLLMRYLHRLKVEEHMTNDLAQEIFIRLLKTLPTSERCSRCSRSRSGRWLMIAAISGLACLALPSSVHPAQSELPPLTALQQEHFRQGILDAAEAQRLALELNSDDAMGVAKRV